MKSDINCWERRICVIRNPQRHLWSSPLLLLKGIFCHGLFGLFYELTLWIHEIQSLNGINVDYTACIKVIGDCFSNSRRLQVLKYWRFRAVIMNFSNREMKGNSLSVHKDEPNCVAGTTLGVKAHDVLTKAGIWSMEQFEKNHLLPVYRMLTMWKSNKVA